jgi:hypothetical protein
MESIMTEITPTPLGSDIITGADAIAAEMGISARSVYHLAKTKRIPVFTLGTKLAARKSTLRKFIEDQEAQAMRGARA